MEGEGCVPSIRRQIIQVKDSLIDHDIPFNITRLLGNDLYTVFGGFFLDANGQSHHAVMKCYSGTSSYTNEAAILTYLSKTNYTESPILYCNLMILHGGNLASIYLSDDISCPEWII